MKIIELINQISKELEIIYSNKEQARSIAIDILQWVTKKTYAQLIAKESFSLNKEQDLELASILEKHIKEHMPLQYIFGCVPFLDLNIKVEPQVLIPRDDTAIWCEYVIEKFNTLKKEELNILDLCTGTGCIGLAFAKAFVNARVYAVDIDPKAIELAKENAKANKVNNISIIESDLFDKIPKDLKFDLILSNPPYLSKQEWMKVDLSVKEWESKTALIASKNGLYLIEKIIKESAIWLRQNKEMKELNLPQLVIEIGHTQLDKVKNILIKNKYKDIESIKDLAKHNRAITARV